MKISGRLTGIWIFQSLSASTFKIIDETSQNFTQVRNNVLEYLVWNLVQIKKDGWIL